MGMCFVIHDIFCDDFPVDLCAVTFSYQDKLLKTDIRCLLRGTAVNIDVANKAVFASLMVLIMLQENVDILDIHLSDDFAGTAESCDILVIAVHGISV